MKRLVAAIAVAVAALILPPSAAAAAPRVESTVVSEPNVIVGTYRFNEAGHRVTVGFVPCGHTFPWIYENGYPITAYDPLAQYTAIVKKGGGFTAQVWAHSPGVLDSTLRSLYDFGLTQEAIDTLNEDAATYSCLTG